jgi:uncharacterized protein YbjT (DUF2867 family)
VVAALDARPGVRVRVVSRRPRPAEGSGRHEWATADLGSSPLEPVVDGAAIVVHLASEKGSGERDVVATGRLLAAAVDAGVAHVVVVSIVGSDRIPLPFYATKQRIEELVRASSVPWPIVRITQFHSFVARLVATQAALPLPSPIVADVRFQSVDERDAAERLVDVALAEARGYAAEIGGPEVLTLAEMASTWLEETGRRHSLLALPLAAIAAGLVASPAVEPWTLPVLEGYPAAENTPPGERRLGTVTFREWVRRRVVARGS